MEDCLQRLHAAILDHESGKTSVWRLEHAFRWFDDQMIKIYEDSSEQMESDSPEVTWGESSSFEAIRLMIGYVLIQADRPPLVCRVGSSSAGKLLTMITSSHSRSLLEHFFALGEAIATLVLTLQARLHVDLSSCTYEFCQTIQTSYPLALKVDHPVKVKSLVSFWVCSIEVYLASVDSSEDLSVVMKILCIIVRNAAVLQLPLIAELGVLRCLELLFSKSPFCLSVYVNALEGAFLWCENSLQDLRENQDFDDKVGVDFVIFLDTLVDLIFSIITANRHASKAVVPYAFKMLKHFVLENSSDAPTSSCWCSVSLNLRISMLVVLKRCISEFPSMFPSMRYMIKCADDLSSHNFAIECMSLKLISRMPSSGLCDWIDRQRPAHSFIPSSGQRKKEKKQRQARHKFRDIILPDESDVEEDAANNIMSLAAEGPELFDDMNLVADEENTHMESELKLLVNSLQGETLDHKTKLLVCETCFQLPLRSAGAILDAYKQAISASLNEDLHVSTITRNSNIIFSLVSLSRVSKFVSKNDNIARKLVDIMLKVIEKLKFVLPFLTTSYTYSCSRQQTYEKNSIAYYILKNNFMGLVGNIIFFVDNLSKRVDNTELFVKCLNDNFQRVLFLESILECIKNSMNTNDLYVHASMCLKIGFPLACEIGQLWNEETVREYKYINVVTDLLRLSTSILLKSYGSQLKVSSAYESLKESAAYVSIFDFEDYKHLSANKRLLRSQIFSAINIWSTSIESGECFPTSDLFPGFLLESSLSFGTECNKLWTLLAKNILGAFENTDRRLPTTFVNELYSLLVEFRLMSAIVNTIDNSMYPCSVGSSIDGEMEVLITCHGHNAISRRQCADLISLSLCEGILSEQKLSDKSVKSIVQFVPQALKDLVQSAEIDDDKGYNMIWTIVPGIGAFIKFSALLSPSKALWGLNLLVDLWTRVTVEEGDEQSFGIDALKQRILEEMYSLGSESKRLALHLFLVEPTRAIDCVVKTLLNHEGGRRLMNTFIKRVLKCNDQVEFLKVFSKSMISSFVANRNKNCLKVFFQFIKDDSDRDRHDVLPTLLDDHLTFYRLLTSSGTLTLDESDLVRGAFYNILVSIGTEFEIRICHGDFPVASVYQKLLLLLMWDLGSDVSIRKKAMKALRIVCTLFKAKTWDISKIGVIKRPKQAGGGSVPIVNQVSSTDLNENVATEISDNFLYCISSLGFSYLKTGLKQISQHGHFLRVLKHMLELIPNADITKFLPKFIYEIDRAICSENAYIRFLGVEIASELLNSMIKEVAFHEIVSMVETVPGLIVSLFSIIECSPLDEQLPIALEFFQEFDFLKVEVYESQYLILSNERVLPKLGRNFITTLYYNTHSEYFRLKARKLAIQTIKDIYSFGPESYSKTLSMIPSFPNVQEIQDIIVLHGEKTKTLTYDAKIMQLCKLLSHESHQVCLLALKILSTLLKENMAAIYSLVSTAAAASAGSSLSSIPLDNVVSVLVRQLMSASSKFKDSATQEACAKCFGQIGALDPAKLCFLLPTIRSSRLRLENSDSDVGSKLALPPWRYKESIYEFGMILLESYLVPAVAACGPGGQQDRTTFAIQEILKVLSTVKVSELDGIISDIIVPRKSSKDKDGSEFPTHLKSDLIQRSIFSVCEPYWKTKYSYSVPLRRTPPYMIGDSLLTFESWIGFICQYLISFCSGPFKLLFDACKGAVRTQSDLSRALLPHLLFDVLVFNQLVSLSSPDQNVRGNILKEFNYILTNQSDETVTKEGQKLANQAIFELSDTVQCWTSTAIKDFAKPKAPKSATGETQVSKQLQAQQAVDRRTQKEHYSNMCAQWPSAVQVLQDLVRDLSLNTLGRAALSIGEHARALRCFEMHVRDVARSQRSLSSLVNGDPKDRLRFTQKDINDVLSLVPKLLRNDGANHELPLLSEEDLDLLMKISMHLDNPDVIDGVKSIRQARGLTSSSWHRKLEYEHEGNWQEALLEYDIIEQQRMATTSSIDHMVGTTTGSGFTKSTRASLFTTSRSDVSELNVTQSVLEEDIMQQVLEERGRLKCLIELGQLHSALDQTCGIIHNSPELEPFLIPLGIEASWRLLSWEALDSFCHRTDNLSTQQRGLLRETSPEDSFQIYIGKLLLSMKRMNQEMFSSSLREARLEVMSSLSTSVDSYGRAYPSLIQLHVLSEIESGFEIISDNYRNEAIMKRSKSIRKRSRVGDGLQFKVSGVEPGDSDTLSEVTSIDFETIMSSLNWSDRLNMLSPSTHSRSLVLAVRRSIFSVANLKTLIANNWLGVSDMFRRSGNVAVAQTALRNAELAGLNTSKVSLQECKILAKAGYVSRALSLLEPVEIDAFAFRKKLKNDRMPRGSSSDKIREQHDLANQVLLATKWMVESRQKLGKIIVERFKVVVELRPHWEEAYFEFGRYLEYLYHEARSREQAGVDAQLQSRQGKQRAAMSSKPLPIDESPQQANIYLLQVIELYAKAALSGTEHITGWLPRMLTLWFSSSMPDALKCKTTLEKLQNRMTKTGESVPAYIWYSCISQLVSRAQHPNPETARIVQTLLITKTLVHMPQQGIWHIAGMLHSHNSERQSIGRSIIREAGHICLREKGFSSATKDMFDDCMKLFRNLADLAVYDAKDRRMNWKFGENCNLTRILVPLKTALHICIPESISNTSGFVHFPSDQMYIKSFSDQVDVASSKARPKIISLFTTCGRKIKFLCKQEKNGDLRKDAHMMEFNAVINRLLQEDPDGRRRRVRLRTFSVICLNEECGILEWVNDTNTLRNLISEAHGYWPEEYPLLQARDVAEELRKAQDDLFGDFDSLLGKYEELILNRYRPYLHRWFFEQYTDPTEWLEAKIFFTRSAAVWSAVGHVIGLGDRHTENILLDTTNGELVHVDFDCLFDKGLTLARAEIVPFRLTPNMVDAMGVCGIEGTYRKTMEVCMKLLRANKDTLLSILEPFLRDPTVAWGRSGRAQQQQKSSAQTMRAPAALTDHDNPDAKEALNKIMKRLDGVYNISHPRAVEISNAYATRKNPAPVRGLGATQDESLPLSVQGQVQRLIDEATDELNLMQMYFGWTPWL